MSRSPTELTANSTPALAKWDRFDGACSQCCNVSNDTSMALSGCSISGGAG